MSSFTNLFKRARAKSERRPNSPSTTYRSEGPVQTPQTPTTPLREFLSQPVTPLSQTPVVVPELPAEWGPFYQAGHGNPHSPLRNLTARPQLPPGSPHINEEEIGTKFPTLSNGPGIERRVFIDPSYAPPQRVATPESDRPSYRSLTPESNRPSYRSLTPEEATSPEQWTPTRPNRRQEGIDDSTVGTIIKQYSDDRLETNQGNRGNDHVEVDPRLSDWNWSPLSSLYTPSVHQPQHTLVNAAIRRHFPPPTAPPTGPLPDLPVNNAEDFFAPGHSQTPLQSTSSAESILERLLAEARTSNANDHNAQGSFSATSFAQVSLLASDGSMHSRQLSARETSAFESEVIDRLRTSGVLGAVDHQYIPQGRLSIEYAESGQNTAGDAGPGDFQSLSSTSEARTGIIRTGTPPLLFGSRAIGTGLIEYGQDDDQDWETMPDSNGRSHRKFGDVETAAGTGSSIADVSDSSNVSALRSVATGQVLVHPPHPRYQHSWTMLQDAQSGNLVLTPDYAGPGVFPLQNTYEHPTQLSPHHHNPFSTSPPNIRISPRTAYNRGESPPPIPPRNPRRLQSQTGTNVDDSEWVSTVGEEEAVSTRQGSFAKAAIVNRRANITGAPDGTGAREVGSSLANASSPANELESPTFQRDLIQRRRTVDGSLDSTEANAPGNFYERIKNHRIFRKDSYDEEFELDFMPTPPEDSSPEFRQRCQDSVEHSLLPHPPTPFSELKQTSVPDCLLKSVNLANMATNGPQAEASSSHAEPSARDSGPDQSPSNGKQRARSVPPRPTEPEPTTTPPRPRTARPYVGPYDDFIQANRGPAQPRAAYMRPGHPDRPVARAGSPHLFRVTGPSPTALRQREKDLSGAIFGALLMCAPFLLLYGYGYLDWVMKWLSRGDIVAFREREKNIAKPVGYIGIAGVLAIILYGASQIHS